MAVSQCLSARFGDPRDKERGVQPFCLETIHDFYKNYHSKWDSSSARLLEFGDGPVIYLLPSASPHFSEITFADNLQSSLDTVQGWKDSAPGAHNWMEYVRYVTCDLEFKRDCNGHCGDGKECDDYVFAREAEIRSKLKMCKFDIRSLSATEELCSSKFDVVSTNFLEIVTSNVEDFRGYVKNLSSLVKPGGFLIGLSSLQGTYCMKEGTRHSILYLEREVVEDAFKSAGLEIVHTACFSIPETGQNVVDDCKALIFLAGQKAI